MSIRPIVLDFETMPIRTRPHYPPEPVSFSLRLPSWRAPKFYAWGHRTGGNNCDFVTAKDALCAAYQSVAKDTPLLMQNGKFDMDVAEVFFGLSLPVWYAFEDTMFLLFLDDPHQRELGLKPAAQRLLGMLPEEQDAVKNWLLEHKTQLEAEFPEIITEHGGIKPSTAGAFIAYVPGNIVAPYANGDVERTLGLFKLLRPLIVERGMLPAYDRERQLLPILLRNEREGVRVDEKALERDQKPLEAAQEKTDAWIRKMLQCSDLDLDKDADVANALYDADALTEYGLTKTGRRSVSKKTAKLSHFKSRELAAAYSYRQKCAMTLETFIRPWRRYTVNECMHTTWNQVRQAKGVGATGGTRTGRPSTDSPNFLNMPKNTEEGDIAGFSMPKHIEDLVAIPKVRNYILPDQDTHVIVRRDYNQQELRVLAHYEDGALMQAYLQNPRLDVHEFVRAMIEQLIGVDIGRKPTKTLNFGFVYGMGLGALALQMGKSIDEVKMIRAAQLGAVPGLKELNDGIKARARGGYITTWGGRQYYKEPPRMSDAGIMMDFAYKLLNYLIQGSSADITKEAIIRYDGVRKEGRLMLSVYDEVDISVPEKCMPQEALILRDAMMSIELDVPLLSDGEWGHRLGDLQPLIEIAPNLSKWGP